MKKPAPILKAVPVQEIVEGPFTDITLLPPRVAAMREKILEASSTFDIEKLRPAIERNEVMPLFGRAGERPRTFATAIEFLRTHSYDGKGREILMVLEAVFTATFVRVKRGPHVIYIWPAFALIPMQEIDADQGETMLRCIAFADLVRDGFTGRPPYHRGEIGEDGTWHAFGVS